MKKYLVLAGILAAMNVATMSAQTQTDPDENYIRNSVYMMKLEEPAPKEEYAEAFKIMNKTFDATDFAKRYERYNDFSLSTRSLDFTKLPEVTQEEMDAIGKESKTEKAVNDYLREKGITYARSEYEYVAKLMKYFDQNNVANKLVAKWYNKPGTPEGKVDWDMDRYTIFQLGKKGLSEEVRSDAKNEQIQHVIDQIENKLLSDTYICVVRYGYMDAQEIVAITSAALEIAAGNNPLLQLGAKKARTEMEKRVKGYFVGVRSYLFQLDWDNDVRMHLYKYVDNPKGFMTDKTFKLKYVGSSFKRAPAGLSLKMTTTLDEIITRAALRGTDASFAALQRDYEDFRPMTSLHVIDGQLAAYIGMKESIKSGDKFEVLEKTQSETDPNLIDWKSIGTIKVGKTVWDNREGAGNALDGESTDKDDESPASATPYTVFTGKPGKMGEGNLIKLAKK